MMEQGNGCALLNAVNDGVLPTSFLGEGHVHIVVLGGELTFSDGKHTHHAYADELCVSPKYLTSVCRKHSDSTASELIATSVMSRVKQLLLYSDLSIKEVAGEMGFDNLPFFGKYVKKHLGLSPNHYRKANGYGK